MTATQRRLSLEIKGPDTYIIRVKEKPSLPRTQKNVVTRLCKSGDQTGVRAKSCVERISQHMNRTMPVIGDHKSLLEGCQLLELIHKLKDQNSFTEISANDMLLINNKSEELTRILRIRCKISIRDDCLNRMVRASSLIKDLREIYFEDNYKLNALKNNRCDDRKRAKITEAFIKICSTRKNLCEEIDQRSSSWMSMMTNANRLMNVTHISLIDEGLELVVHRTVKQLKYLRFCATSLLRTILEINSEIMTLLIDSLPFEAISQVCYSINQFNITLVSNQIKPLDIIPIVATNRVNVTANKFLYYIYNEVNKSIEVFKQVNSSDGQLLTEEITSDYFSASSTSTTKNKSSRVNSRVFKDSKIVFNILIQSNQRVLLKLIFGNNQDDSDRNQVKIMGVRQKWCRTDPISHDFQQRVCQQLDKQFWSKFWTTFNQSMNSSLCFCQTNSLSVPISVSYNPSKSKTIRFLLEAFARDDELLDEAIDSLDVSCYNLALRSALHNYSQNFPKLLDYKSRSILKIERREVTRRTGTTLGQCLLDCIEPLIEIKVKYKRFMKEFESVVDTVVSNLLQMFVSFVESKQSVELEFKLLDLIALSVIDINNLTELLTLNDSKSMNGLIKTLVTLKKNTVHRAKEYVFARSYDLISRNIPIKQYRRKICSSNSQWIENIIALVLEPINQLLKSDSFFESNVLNSSLIDELCKSFVKFIHENRTNFSHSGAVQFDKDVNALWDWMVNNNIQSTDSESIVRLKSFSYSLVNKDIPISTSLKRYNRINPELSVHQTNQIMGNHYIERSFRTNFTNCLSFIFCSYTK